MVNKDDILDVVSDLVGAFLYYDRKDDELMPRGEIEKAIKNGVISVDDITSFFTELLNKSLVKQ